MRKHLLIILAAVFLLPGLAMAQYPTQCGTDGYTITWDNTTGQFKCSAPPSGSSVQVNGTVVSNPNFNGTTPAAPAGNTNVTFQVSGSSVSAYVPTGGGSTYPGCTGVTNGIACTGQLEAGTYLKADANAWGKSVENLQTATVADLATITTTNASVLAVGSTVWVTDAASCGDTTVGGGSIKERLEVTAMGATSPSAWAVLNCFDPSTAFASSSMVPASIPNLVLWVSGDRTHWTNGGPAPYWNDPYTGNVATSSAGATFTTGAINTQPAMSFGGSSAGRYTIQYPLSLANATIFVVLKVSGSGAIQSILSGAGNSLQLRMNTTNQLVLTQDGTVDIATNATALTTGTWYQANATYNSTTGSYAFRVNEAAGTSGTNAKTISANTSAIGYNVLSTEDLNSVVAEIIVYNRVLTSPEITNVETYLHSKYGI